MWRDEDCFLPSRQGGAQGCRLRTVACRSSMCGTRTVQRTKYRVVDHIKRQSSSNKKKRVSAQGTRSDRFQVAVSKSWSMRLFLCTSSDAVRSTQASDGIICSGMKADGSLSCHRDRTLYCQSKGYFVRACLSVFGNCSSYSQVLVHPIGMNTSVTAVGYE